MVEAQAEMAILLAWKIVAVAFAKKVTLYALGRVSFICAVILYRLSNNGIYHVVNKLPYQLAL